MVKSGRVPAFFVLLSVFFINHGCMDKRGSDQPELGQVQGTVTLDGKPFAGAVIVFTPELGRQSTGIIDENGKYELEYLHHSKGAKLGQHTIGFAAPPEESKGAPKIPKKYLFGTDTGLEANVKEGTNTFDFSLSTK